MIDPVIQTKKLESRIAKDTPRTGDVERLPEINGLRGIAILMVLFGHLYENLFLDHDNSLLLWNDGYQSISWWMETALRQSWTGVNVFFVLSGFVLFRPFVRGTRQLETRRDLIDFYIRRAWRLIPLLFISTLIFLALLDPNKGGWDLFKQLAETTTGLFAFNKHFFPPVNGILWSLGVEIWYSLLFPLVAFLLLRRNLVFWVIALYFVALITRIFGAEMTFSFTNLFKLNPVKDSIFGRIDDFVAGMSVCMIYYRLPQSSWFRSSIMGILGIIITISGYLIWDLAGSGFLPHWTIAIANIPINIGVSVLLLYALSYPAGIWASLLRFESLQVCGIMCYSIYIWHMKIMRHLVQDSMNYSQVAMYLGFLFLVAMMSWLLIENANLKDFKARLRSLNVFK